MSRARAAALVPALLVLLLTAGCSGGGTTPEPSASPSASPSAAASASGDASADTTPPTAPVRATEPPAPEVGTCHRLTFAAALAPTSRAPGVSCRRAHTARTVDVGRLRTVEQGHLLAVDAAAVRDQPAARCPRAFADFVGGSRTDRRLSMLRTVWFTPTVAQSDRGADWYRCDVIAVAADQRLARLKGRLDGVLGRPAGDRWGMCGTAAPDADAFRRVVCSRAHSWRAIDVVDLAGPRYPGTAAARARGQGPCEAAGRDAAADPLDFEWGYEWPTRPQWRAGQTYGRCWAPD